MFSCPNCGSEVQTRFCGGCGQEQGQLLIPVRVWLSEVASDLFLVALVFAVYVGFAAKRAFPRVGTGTAARTVALLSAYFVVFWIAIIATAKAVVAAYLGSAVA